MLTKNQYTKKQLASTIASTISLINVELSDELLADAAENNTWSQPWYYPRKPASSIIDNLYLEYLDGGTIEVIESITLPSANKMSGRKTNHTKGNEISPINAFNEQYPLVILLHKYGYKKVYTAKEYEKWLSPHSKSGKAGITLKDNKFFSHHDDKFNDGFWHDAFDLMRASEGLSENEAIKKTVQKTLVLNGRIVDERNKSVANKIMNTNNIPSQSTPHAEILDKLIKKFSPVNFRTRANLGDAEKLTHAHFQIIAVDTILDLAKHQNWGLCRNQEFIYLYNGAYWYFLDRYKLQAFLGDAAQKMGIDEFKARNYKFRDEIYKQFIALADLPKQEQPKDAVSINLKNGTFEITSTDAHLRSFSPNDFLTYQLPFKYDPNAQAPLFQKYLDRVLPDKTLQSILSEYLGYIFIRTSTLKLEKALILFGSGANGKSVFYEVVRNLLGEQNTSEYSLQNLTNDTGYQRAMIANKLVNYASEINGRLETSIFKQIVSGEPVEARLPYGDPFIITDYAKLIFNCNELPKDVEQTRAYFRRFLIIPFDVTIPDHEQDTQLAKKIIDTELSGAFNWGLAGLNRLLEQKKFTDSQKARDILAQYEKESDSVKLFLDEVGYKSSSEGYVTIKVLYSEYRAFCVDGGFKPVNSLNFRKRLENFNIVINKKNIGQVAYVTKSYE